jgi:hypothetical protein
MRTHFGLVASAALVAMLAWSPPVVAQQKTFRQCREEWAANKAAIAASGKTQRVFVAECRGVPLPPISPAELGKGQYGSEAEAKAACLNDPIVWVNLRSKVYHESGSRNYGSTKTGAYMCQKDTIAAGFHAPKASREPGAPGRAGRLQVDADAAQRVTCPAGAPNDKGRERAVSSAGRAPALHAGCRRFESVTAHQFFQILSLESYESSREKSVGG